MWETRATGHVGITKEEIGEKLRALVVKRTGGSDVASQKKFFAIYDTNKDGKLEKAELSRLLDDAGACAWVGCDITAEKVIEEVDRDGDKRISWAEYAVTAGIVETEGKPTDPRAIFLSDVIAALEDARRELDKEAAKAATGPLRYANERAAEQGQDFVPVMVSLVTGVLSVVTLGSVALRT
jgi:hypothetical protein